MTVKSAFVSPRTLGQARPPLPDDAELLLEEFLRSRRLEEGTQQVYYQALKSWTRRIPTPLGEADTQAVATWYARLAGERYAAATILMYAVKLRAIYAWTLRRRGVKRRTAITEAGELFDEVPFRDLKRQTDRDSELRDELVTPEEYEALMTASDHPRVRALLATLYESACRPEELLSTRVRDLDFRDRYAMVRVSGKTGERTVPLVRAIPYLRAWLQVHPARGDPDAPLFARVIHGRIAPVTVDGLQTRFRRLLGRAGLRRRIHPYMFRHTRLTELAENDLGEFKMKKLAGWTTDSRMAARYVHLSGRSSLAPILEMEGVEVPAEDQPRESPVRTRACSYCGVVNEGDALYCMRCGLALDAVAVSRDVDRVKVEEELLEGLLRHPRARATLLDAIRGLLAEGAAADGAMSPRG